MFFVFEFLKLRFVASLRYQMPLKHYLSPQSGRRLAERSEAIIFLEQIPWTSYPETPIVLPDLLNDYQPNYPSPPHRWPGGMRAALKSAASQRESRACRSARQSRAPSLMASSRFPAWVLGPHLFFSSPGVRSLRRAGPQRASKYCFFNFWSIFTPSKKWLEFYLEKIGPKMQKSWIWGSPNPPKTDPKSFLNWGRQKMMIFR